MQIVEFISVLLVYIAVFIIANIYRKRAKRPISWWKIVFSFFVGIFSFSINFNIFNENHQFALIPLGAFFFYLFTKNNGDRWETYKPFVWIGFLTNYAFFVVGLLIIPIQHMLFPPDELNTFVKNFDEAYVVTTHLSANDNVELVEDATELIEIAIQGNIVADEWHWQLNNPNQYSYEDEAFPYVITNFEKPLGMSIPYNIFVRKDGKGLLIIMENEQYYFEIAEPILLFGGAKDE